MSVAGVAPGAVAASICARAAAAAASIALIAPWPLWLPLLTAFRRPLCTVDFSAEVALLVREKLAGSNQLGTCKVLDLDGAIQEVKQRLAGLPAVHAYTWLSLGDMPDDLVERHVELWCGPVRAAVAAA